MSFCIRSFFFAVLLWTVSATVSMNRQGDVIVHSVLDGDIVLHTDNGQVFVESQGVVTNLLQQLQVARTVAGQLCWMSPSFPLPEWDITSVPQMPTPAWDVATVVINNDIFVIGGADGGGALSSVQILHTDWTGSRNFSWSSAAPLNVPRIQPYAAVTSDRKWIYVFGGSDNSGNPLSSFERYDVLQNTWTVLGSMPNSTAQGASAVVSDVVYFFGGLFPAQPTANVMAFDMIALAWKGNLPAMSAPRYAHAAVAVGNNIYIVGGHDGVIARSDVIMLNTIQRRWFPRGSFGTGLQKLSLVSLQGVVFSVGGKSQFSTAHFDVDVLNPRTNLWKTSVARNLAVARESHQAVNIMDEAIFVIGGKNGNASPAIGTVEFVQPC